MTDRKSIAAIRAELSAAGALIRRLSPVEKAQANPQSKSLAIRAKCWQCAGGGADGAGQTKQTISTCAVTGCALWPVRPYKEEA